jgi:hypothetical protein
LLADLRYLGGMEADLAVFGAGVVDVEDPLEVPSAAGTGGAGDCRGMKGVTFEERAAENGIERRKTSKKLAGPCRGRGLFLTSHL